jgi:hypothetical protein
MKTKNNTERNVSFQGKMRAFVDSDASVLIAESLQALHRKTIGGISPTQHARKGCAASFSRQGQSATSSNIVSLPRESPRPDRDSPQFRPNRRAL